MAESAQPQAEADPGFLSWPPFPLPPAGVTLIPFREFEPKGIFKVKEPFEEEEFDAEGVPTIKLAVEHGSLQEKAARERLKRARKRQRAAAQGGAGLTAAEMAEQRSHWYEVWEDLDLISSLSEPINP
jgi:hypothetical protein